ncbi:MAG: TM2 domain-containing protein [Pirellulaceae bacterium]
MSYAPAYERKYVKYVPVGYATTHSNLFAYILWLFGFMGLHRFYLGRPVSGTIWFFTLGLLGVGWIIDLFLIPGMVNQCNARYQMGRTDYSVTWLLFYFGGYLGLHRFYQGKLITGIVYLLTFGLMGIGLLYDLLTLNEQVDNTNRFYVSWFDVPAMAGYAAPNGAWQPMGK